MARSGVNRVPDNAIPGLDISVWSAGELSPQHRPSFPATAILSLGETGEMVASRGRRRLVDEVITANTPADTLDEMPGSTTASVLKCGHTHVPLLRKPPDTNACWWLELRHWCEEAWHRAAETRMRRGIGSSHVGSN